MNFNPAQEGGCLLYDGVTGYSTFGVGLGRRLSALPAFGKRPVIGYAAYPNPTLKNKIPPRRFYEYEKLMHSGKPLPQPKHTYHTSGTLEQSVTKKEYIRKIHAIKELLAAGEVYQIDYAIRFRKKFAGDPYAFFCGLIKSNPALFAAYLNCGDFHIASASPERLFKVKNGTIIAQPIKGTAPKSEGRAALDYLMRSEKERAELDMITDLSRNDIGKICRYGTLRIERERELMELPNLWHTYSEVRGKLAPGVSRKAVFDALFPGGSITGCPKIRAMQYIEKLEKLPRNIFTGAIGYAEGGTMDFNIAIRTALICGGYIEYWAGGGIVADSDPEKEYEECLLKAERFLQIL